MRSPDSPPSAHRAGDVKADDAAPKPDTGAAGQAEVVKEDGHTEQVDFKNLTAEEAFHILGVRCFHHRPSLGWTETLLGCYSKVFFLPQHVVAGIYFS